MKFDGFWVFEADGKVVLESGVFDDTELDPATNWTEAWQNQDADAAAKGFVGVAPAVTHAARLLARSQSAEVSEEQIAAIQRTASIFQGGRCAVSNLEDLSRFCMVLNSLAEMCSGSKAGGPALPLAGADEIPFP